jgi:hypothetical protein
VPSPAKSSSTLTESHRDSPHRAWKFAPGGRFEVTGPEGYLLRAKIHWYQSRDIEVSVPVYESASESLEPIP